MRKRKIIILSELFLILAMLCVGTYAYYIDSEEVVNIAHDGHSKIEIVENFPKPPSKYTVNYMQTKDVKIQNLEDKSYVRCFIEVSDENLIKDGYCKLVFSGDANWVKSGDYWYYKKPLDRGQTSASLLKGVQFLKEMNSGAFNVIVYAESVQAEGFSDYQSAFNGL